MSEESILKTGNYIIHYKNGEPISRSRVYESTEDIALSHGGGRFYLKISDDGTVNANPPQPHDIWSHKIQTTKRLKELEEGIERTRLIEFIQDGVASICSDKLREIALIINPN